MSNAPSATPHTRTATSLDPVAGDPAAVVAAYHEAWTSGWVDLALERLSEEAVCHAPGAQEMTKEDWRAYLTAFVPMLTGVPEQARMSNEDQVALWYYPQTAATSTTLASELFTVHEGRIIDIHLTFDRLGYAPAAQQGR